MKPERYAWAAAPKIPHAVCRADLHAAPICRIGNLVESKIVGREAASKYLKELARLGVLEEEKVGRDKVFLHRKYLDVLFSDEHTFEPYPRQARIAHQALGVSAEMMSRVTRASAHCAI